MLAATLVPGSPTRIPEPIACFWCDRYAAVDAVLNLLLLIPLGVGLGIAGLRPVRAALVMLALSLAVETLQLLVIQGRDPSVRDVVMNVAGGLAGLVIGRHWRALVDPHRRMAWRFAGAARLVWILVHLAGGWLVAPSLPADKLPLIAGTHVGGYADFEGQLLRYAIATQPRPGAAQAARDDRVLAAVTAQLRPGARRDSVTPILTLVEQVGVFPLMLALQGDDLVLHLRTRAEDLQLRSPAWRMRDVIRPWYRVPEPLGAPLLVQVLRTPHQVRAMVQTSSAVRFTSTVTVRSAQLWAMLAPTQQVIDDGFDEGSALFCAVLLLPLGYWSALSRRRQRFAWTLALTAAGGGLIVGPLFFQAGYPEWGDVAGCVVGLAIGAALAIGRRYASSGGQRRRRALASPSSPALH